MSYHDNPFADNYIVYNPNTLHSEPENKTNTDNSEKLKIVKDEVEKTKQQTIITIDNALRRGNELDDLIERAEDLEIGTRTFYRKSYNLKKQMWYDHCTKQFCFIGGTIVVFIVLILIILLVTNKKHH
jgi:hypothetical protein